MDSGCRGWAVEKEYAFEGPDGRTSLPGLFAGRRQLVIYRAFFDPGVHGWPEHACVGCSMVADHVGNLAHLNARDTTLVFVSRAPQPDIVSISGGVSGMRTSRVTTIAVYIRNLPSQGLRPTPP
jgi:predicted dithiol-disulfide oxidoreductase (DUF899 family)